MYSTQACDRVNHSAQENPSFVQRGSPCSKIGLFSLVLTIFSNVIGTTANAVRQDPVVYIPPHAIPSPNFPFIGVTPSIGKDQKEDYQIRIAHQIIDGNPMIKERATMISAFALAGLNSFQGQEASDISEEKKREVFDEITPRIEAALQEEFVRNQELAKSLKIDGLNESQIKEKVSQFAQELEKNLEKVGQSFLTVDLFNEIERILSPLPFTQGMAGSHQKEKPFSEEF